MSEFPFFQEPRDAIVWQMTVGHGDTERNNQRVVDLLSMTVRGLSEAIQIGLEEAGKKPENHLIGRLTEDYVQTIVDHELPNDTD